MIKQFKKFVDERGELLPIEHSELPFIPKRTFIIKDIPSGTLRGGHAHFFTQQYLICLSGNIIVYLNDGQKTMIVSLKKNEGVYIPELTWDSQWFGENSALLVFASTAYDRNDYITDWKQFERVTKTVGVIDKLTVWFIKFFKKK